MFMGNFNQSFLSGVGKYYIRNMKHRLYVRVIFNVCMFSTYLRVVNENLLDYSYKLSFKIRIFPRC